MYTVKVYTSITKGNKKATFEFEVDSIERVRTHVRQAFEQGYSRRIDENSCEIYPAHIIEKIEVIGPDLDFCYNDQDIT